MKTASNAIRISSSSNTLLASDEVLYDNLISYSQAIEYLSEDEATDDMLWKFRRIISHQGPLTSKEAFQVQPYD
jgi:hypothetical protein